MTSFTDFESAVETLLARTPEQQRAYLQHRYSAGATHVTPLPLAWSLAHVQHATVDQVSGGEPTPQEARQPVPRDE